MILDSIFLAIFIISLGGVLLILVRKVPVLAALPKNGTTGIKKHKFILDLENKIREAHFDLFIKQTLLHKALSFIKIWTLKLEVGLDHLLHKIRKKAQEVNKQASKNFPK